ncbi:response regulator transcription factor [Clostridia bacterium OttesenSCG-928-O13]|nr:response regulator transcription factor [Clostridia bacterium OttesenSCG-928-O13]
MKVLIVEDERGLASALEKIMREQHYMTDVVHDGQDGLAYAQSGQYDLVLLDVMLPGLSGFEVARRLRAEKSKTPVLMLTARDAVPDKVKGLDAGADDYMTKPFSTEELLARVRALLRRPGEMVHEELSFGDLSLELSTGVLRCAEQSVKLGHREFEILKILMAAKESLTSKETLLVKVWGVEADVGENNVEAYISFLRKKLYAVGAHVTVEAVRKMGYRLEEQPS